MATSLPVEDNNDELNQKITEWLGKCWHDFSVPGEPCVLYCSKCSAPDAEYDFGLKIYLPVNSNIDFVSSKSAWLEYIVPELEDEYDIMLNYSSGFGWEVTLHKKGDIYNHIDVAETLPMAVARTVEGIIDAEGEAK